MTEIHQHKHEHDAIGVEVQLPSPVELQVMHTYRIEDDTKSWLGKTVPSLILIVLVALAVFLGTVGAQMLLFAKGDL